CPAYRQAELLADLDGELAEKVAGIAYNRVAVVAMGFRREDVPHPLDGFGYIAPQRTRGDVLGVQWCSSIFPGRAPDGTVLLRAICGGWPRGGLPAYFVGGSSGGTTTTGRSSFRACAFSGPRSSLTSRCHSPRSFFSSADCSAYTSLTPCPGAPSASLTISKRKASCEYSF